MPVETSKPINRQPQNCAVCSGGPKLGVEITVCKACIDKGFVASPVYQVVYLPENDKTRKDELVPVHHEFMPDIGFQSGWTNSKCGVEGCGERMAHPIHQMMPKG